MAGEEFGFGDERSSFDRGVARLACRVGICRVLGGGGGVVTGEIFRGDADTASGDETDARAILFPNGDDCFAGELNSSFSLLAFRIGLCWLEGEPVHLRLARLNMGQTCLGLWVADCSLASQSFCLPRLRPEDGIIID